MCSNESQSVVCSKKVTASSKLCCVALPFKASIACVSILPNLGGQPRFVAIYPLSRFEEGSVNIKVNGGAIVCFN